MRMQSKNIRSKGIWTRQSQKKGTETRQAQTIGRKIQQTQEKERTKRQTETTHSKVHRIPVYANGNPSSEIRCFPYFYLLGFAKSGTTDLYESLTSLDSIYRQWKKEPDFWSRQRMNALGWSSCHPKSGKQTYSPYANKLGLEIV